MTIKHVYREQNSQADALCNEAMDNPRDSARALLAADGRTKARGDHPHADDALAGNLA